MTLTSGMYSRRAALGGAGLLAAACISPEPPQAAAAPRRYTMPNTLVLPFHSAINGVDYEIYVRPPQTPTVGEAPPLILTLDADYQFAIAANHVEHLAGRMNQGPNAVVASIAYAGQYPDRTQYQRDRSRDYTPVFWPTGGYGEEFQKASGGGPDFLRVITEEALPLLAAHTPVSTTERTIVGHSYGGLFAAWVLCTHPEAFNNYLLVSPSLWYADKFLIRAMQSGNIPRIARPTRVYMGVGSWEEQPENDGYMVSELTTFAQALETRADPMLEQELRVFEDETHASIFPPCFSTGIRHLFYGRT